MPPFLHIRMYAPYGIVEGARSMGLTVDILYCKLLIAAEKERYAPDCRNGHEYIDCTAENAVRSA